MATCFGSAQVPIRKRVMMPRRVWQVCRQFIAGGHNSVTNDDLENLGAIPY